jgi:hypothetical protein
MQAAKKITKATFKSFLKKNPGKIYVKTRTRFDGMTDGIEDCQDQGWSLARAADHTFENNLGIAGVWLVGGSRNYFREVKEENFTGIDVYNCCGHFMVGVRV